MFEIDANPRHDFSAIVVNLLSDREVRKLWRDVANIVQDETDMSIDTGFSYAERTLLDRIGGQGNLSAYVDTLMAQPRR